MKLKHTNHVEKGERGCDVLHCVCSACYCMLLYCIGLFYLSESNIVCHVIYLPQF